jgi:NAD(P)-dependent dehydrogenase (short-subunit alcohol dehydrogenase family)
MTQRLQGKRVLVTGVTGNVGFGVAQAMLGAGAQVVSTSRDPAGADAARAALGEGLTVHVGDLSREADAARLRALVLQEPLDHAVVSLGPWWQGGPIVAQSAAEYRKVMAQSLDGHVFAAQAFLPALRARAGSSYTIVTGAGGRQSNPGTGLLVIAVAGVYALSRMLRVEHAADAVRVNEVLIATRVEKVPRPRVTAASDFGEAMVRLALGQARGQVLEFTSLEAFKLEGEG